MKLSVIIPCRNAAATLGQTLCSVLGQTRPPDELLVVDDGSSDESTHVAAAFAPHVLVIANPGRGAGAARRAGAQAAKGDALMFLDADDLLAPTALAELSATLARRPSEIACCPWRRLERVDDLWISRPASCDRRGWLEDPISAWLHGWHHPPCSVLWSRAAYERSGGWDPTVLINQDGELMLRGLLAGASLVFTERTLAYYRRPAPGEASLSMGPSAFDRSAARRAVLERLTIHRPLLSWRQLCALAAAFDRLEGSQSHARAIAGPRLLRRLGALGRRVDVAAGRVARRWRTWTAPASRRLAPQALPTRAPSSATTAPLVSVVIPTFNRAKTLVRALASVWAQTYRRLELIVVDDGSTDATAALMDQQGDPRLRYLPLGRNGGVAQARNAGIKAARGDYVAFLDSDDSWAPQKLEAQLAIFASGPQGLGLVYSGVETWGDRGLRSLDRPEARGYIYPQLLRRNVVIGGGSNAMLPRQVFDVVGGFDPEFPAIEDYEFWLRVSQYFLVDYVDAPLIRYFDEHVRVDPAMAARRSRAQAADTAARRLLHRRYGHDMRHAGVEHAFLLSSARRCARQSGRPASAAAELAWQAVLANPFAIAGYAWLGLSSLPPNGRDFLRRAWSKGRGALALRTSLESHP